ncbi:hypothetical protein D1007_31455 [Hordeum vulgare]|nr:hypothetical protein D1007_31455 [Hordeum vulgare]
MEGEREAAEVKLAHESALAKAGAAAHRCEEAEASLTALQDEQVAPARQLQLWEVDFKASEAKLAVRDSELEEMAAEQAMERGHLEALQRGMTEAQEAYTKHVFEANTKMDTRTKEVEAEADAKAVEARIAFSSLELRVFCGGARGRDPEGDVILEDECRDLFSVAGTRVFTRLLLHEPNFNFDKVTCPVHEESRDDLAKDVESHISTLLGKLSHSSAEEPGEAAVGDENGRDYPSF